MCGFHIYRVLENSVGAGWLWEGSSVCRLKVECSLTFTGHTLEHNRHPVAFQLYIVDISSSILQGKKVCSGFQYDNWESSSSFFSADTEFAWAICIQEWIIKIRQVVSIALVCRCIFKLYREGLDLVLRWWLEDVSITWMLSKLCC